MNCWESFYTHIFQQQNTLIEEQKSTTLTHYNLSRHKTKRHVVQYPLQFSTHHLSTKVTSTQGKSIIRYNSSSTFIFYQPISFYITLNLVLFIAEYPDVYTAT